MLNRGFFQQDDFAIGGLAAQPFSWHLLFQNYFGHLMPGVFALAWGPVHAGGYDWGLWAGTLVLLQALAGLALLRALRTLCGDRMVLLIPLGLFLFTPMTLADLSWWRRPSRSHPARAGHGGRPTRQVHPRRPDPQAVFAALWVLFGLAFFEKAAGIPLLLFALTSAYLIPEAWPQAMLTTLRKHWIAWAMYGGIIVAEIVIYALSLASSPGQVRVPEASSAATFGWNLLVDTFVPTAFGGPWHWAPPFGTPRSWTLYAVASPPPELLGISWILAALVVITSLWYRRRTWPAWVILLGWLLVVDIFPILLGRLANFGTLLSDQTIYVADAAPVLAICLAIAFLPLRGEQDAYRTALPPVRPRTVAICAVAVAFIASSVSSAIAYRSELHPLNSRSYLATASAALADVPPGRGHIPNAGACPGSLVLVRSALPGPERPGPARGPGARPAVPVDKLTVRPGETLDDLRRAGPASPGRGPGAALVPVPPQGGLRAHRRRHGAAAHRRRLRLPLLCRRLLRGDPAPGGSVRRPPVPGHAPRQPARLRLPAGARSRELRSSSHRSRPTRRSASAP